MEFVGRIDCCSVDSFSMGYSKQRQRKINFLCNVKKIPTNFVSLGLLHTHPLYSNGRLLGFHKSGLEKTYATD